ncbi:hypothetical protein UNDKW_4928 [Undibacterium sp. KW1]|nr:hypothetical protein UNDKW_4928 [Undibacterium sp. KW1]
MDFGEHTIKANCDLRITTGIIDSVIAASYAGSKFAGKNFHANLSIQEVLSNDAK